MRLGILSVPVIVLAVPAIGLEWPRRTFAPDITGIIGGSVRGADMAVDLQSRFTGYPRPFLILVAGAGMANMARVTLLVYIGPGRIGLGVAVPAFLSQRRQALTGVMEVTAGTSISGVRIEAACYLVRARLVWVSGVDDRSVPTLELVITAKFGIDGGLFLLTKPVSQGVSIVGIPVCAAPSGIDAIARLASVFSRTVLTDFGLIDRHAAPQPAGQPQAWDGTHQHRADFDPILPGVPPSNHNDLGVAGYCLPVGRGDNMRP